MEEYRFRKLIVWQRSVELAAEVHRIAKGLRAKDSSGLGDQMRRAAMSIPANIAEGNGRYHRGDYLRFLSIANGSLCELETHLELALRMGLVPPAELASAQDLMGHTARLLTRLIQSLRLPDSAKP